MNTSNTISKIGAVFYIVWALLASSGRLFGIPAWSVIGFVNGARTSIPRCMEPLVLFDHFHFRGCDVELAEQRLGLYWINFATVGIASACSVITEFGTSPPRSTPAKTEQAVPNLVNMGPKQKYVYVGRWPREGISDPRGEEQREVAVPALVLKIENRILSDDRKIVRALNVIAKLKFRNKNEGAEHHIDYGVWLTLRATAPILASAIHANYC
jgi:hypothetical protein